METINIINNNNDIETQTEPIIKKKSTKAQRNTQKVYYEKINILKNIN